MAKDCFTFRQFSVHQDRCAMKVGTDGTLLGAWALAPEEKCRILDIGTGTGLIALMMAQRYPQAEITGVEIDSDACAQAKGNVNNSRFRDRITIVNTDISCFNSEPFDTIVSNPPYFVNSLVCPDKGRSMARHSDSLSYSDLFKCVCRLLSETGKFSLVIPSDSISDIESTASLSGLFLSRKYSIKTTPKKNVKRFLLEFVRHNPDHIDMSEEVLEVGVNEKSDWYKGITSDFYL